MSAPRDAPGMRSTAATIVTHSPTVAVALAAHPRLQVLVLGGLLFRHSMVNMGAALFEAAAETVVLASAEKLGAASPFLIAPLAELGRLVVTPAAPTAAVRALQAAGAQVVVAGRPG